MSEPAKTVLVTGANGFVGSRLCAHLHTEGMQVFAGVRDGADLTLLEGCDVTYRCGDVTNPDALAEMVRDVDYIVHNAGIVKARTPEQFFKVNAEGTRAMCEAAARYNPELKRFAYISSQAAAGPTYGDRPRTEDDRPAPVTAYGRSKLKGEEYALSYADRFPVAALRAAGVYGPGDKEIFSFFKAVHNRTKPMIGDTSRKLQLVHVDDLCRAVHAALTRADRSGLVCFVAEPRAYSMDELIGHLQQACNRRGVPLVIPSPLFKTVAAISGGVSKLLGMTPMLTSEKADELLASWEVSTDRALEEMGFQAQISFPVGAKQTYDWYIGKGWLR